MDERIPPDFPGAVMFDEAELQEVAEVIRAQSPFRYYGPCLLNKVQRFEIALAERIGVKYSLAVSSGTAALIVGLRALGIGPGDEVIVPANAFIACASAVLLCGAKPVYAEIDESLTLDPKDIVEKISSKTKAIMPLHFAGSSCAMDQIMQIAKEREIAVLEDCAQACGAKYGGRFVGSFGDIGAFSFQINKIITTGEGGAITTSDPGLYERAVRAHDHGILRNVSGKVVYDCTGKAFLSENFRMSEITAAIGLAQLRKLDMIVMAMRQNKSRLIEDLGQLQRFKLAKTWDPNGDAGRCLILLAESPELALALEGALTKLGFHAEIPYEGRPVYDHPQVARCRFWYDRIEPQIGESADEDYCPKTRDILQRSVVIGISPKFSPYHIELLVQAIQDVDRKGVVRREKSGAFVKQE